MRRLPGNVRDELGGRSSELRVLVAARDVRVRRSLSSLLELDGNGVMAVTDAPRLLLELDADLRPMWWCWS